MRFPWSPKPTSAFNWNLNSYMNGQLIDFKTFTGVPNLALYDERNVQINSSDAEYPEQYIAHTYVDPSSTVLELGARYGSVSCIINKKLTTKSNQVSVEPDSTVWDALEKNILQNGCSVHIFKGFVSTKSRDLLPFGYAATSVVSETTNLPSSSVQEIESLYGLQFDTLVADCEGFLEDFFDEHPHLYEQLSTVIFEADYPQKCNYSKIRTNLQSHGFTEILSGFQNVYKK